MCLKCVETINKSNQSKMVISYGTIDTLGAICTCSYLGMEAVKHIL